MLIGETNLSEFPEVGGSTSAKLESDLTAVAGVIFKQCMMGQPLKSSNSETRARLPGQPATISGNDEHGKYVGDIRVP